MTKYTYGDQNTQDGKKPLYIPDESGNVSLGSSAAQSGQRYAEEGYTPPAGIVGKEAVKEMQRMLGGLTVDGVWGPKTQKQYDKFVISTLRDKEAPTTSNDTNLLGYVEDLYQLSLGVGKSDRGNYVMRGYDPPAGIRSAEDVRAFQESNGLDVDGVWGPRTQKRYDLLQAQSAARQAGQYDPDEVERLLNDGMRNIPGTERTADILSYSRGGELANTPVVQGRAAKDYTIPAGVYDVAATQQLLGVKADGMWGEDTDRAYKNLMSGGGQAPDSGQKVADALDGLYAQVNTSGLNKAQKTRAIALLETLKLYGDTEYIRKTLLGIQMAGGAEKFFTTLSGPSGYALIDMQKKERQALQTRLAQTERAIADIPLWNRWVSPTPEYQELQREKAGLQEQIGTVEARLSEISPDWETVWDIWDWSEVDAWEKQQTALAEQAERESFAKQAASLVYPDALPVGLQRNITVTKEQLKSIGWENVDDKLMLGLMDAMERCEINTPMRLLYFLTMITHEGDYNRGDLTEKGDTYTKKSIAGGTYRGAGYIQLTGENNYRAFSEYMNDPLILEKGAERVAELYPWEATIWFWNYRRVNKFIDEEGTLDAVTERIRGKGEVASSRRWECFNRVYAALFGESS